MHPDRVVFAPRVARAKNYARLRLADLLVDTLVYGAHSTTTDALWAGLPVLTLPTDSGFLSRVSLSLIRAVGLGTYIALCPPAKYGDARVWG